MTREQLVKDIIGKEAENLGFSYQGCEKSMYGAMYNYERNRFGFAQTILITTTSIKGIGKWIGMEFLGCAWGNGNIAAEKLMESKYDDGKMRGLKFNSEKEIKEIFEHLARIIREKAKEAFELKEYPQIKGYEENTILHKEVGNLNAAKWIKQIIGKEAEQLGFSYRGSNRDGYTRGYTFLHKEEEYEECIDFTIVDNGIRMLFMRYGMGNADIEANCLLESNYITDAGGFTLFNNEQEFKEVLEHLARIIREKGREAFDLMKPAKEEYAGKEMQWKLYQEHEELNQQYRKLYRLEDTEFTTGLVSQIMKIIVENRDKELKVVEELLIGLSAVYGDQLIRKCGGRWEWREERFSQCWIVGLHGKGQGIIPLNEIMYCWREKVDQVEILLENFRRMPHDTVI
ncbi:MAG: hypothetical protein MR383_09445 [Lachnospiraceae bacterium]|nr:hypothetical protein [Lachnospiraceae bacterium]